MDQPPRRGIHALASMLPKVTAPIFKSRGFAEAGILTDWPAIVGSHLATHTMPEKIAFARGARTAGVLHIVTESAFAPELQHLEPQVIERINRYFGYYAVGRLRIQHGRVVRATLDKAKPAISAPQIPGTGQADDGDAATVRGLTATVEDEPLRSALERLGRAIGKRQKAGRMGSQMRGLPGKTGVRQP